MNLAFLYRKFLKIYEEKRELRKKLNQYEKVYPPKECPICGYKGIDFLPFPNIIHKEVMCPICGSHERHRAIWLYLEKNKQLLKNGNKILHFAPEIQFHELFASKNIEYHGVDLNPENHPFIEEKVDIQNIPYTDDYFDLIICSHVLEHVPNDIKAMSEIRRVLKPKSIALILVPMNGISYNLPFDETKTLEKEEYNTSELREKYYGQSDHLRLYGTDFKNRIHESGLELLSEDFIKHLGIETVEKYALIRNEKIYECTK